MSKLVSGNQTAFIPGRLMLDGCLIANEIVHHAKKKKMKMFLFKVDFEKAFDSVNWIFLFHTMEQMGFGKKWIGWINGCLKSASTSILINGTPSKEFLMERGLRQGDPLSPFLFLLAGEVLQLMILNACNMGLFNGIRLVKSNRNISLLQFADDALIFGKWSRKNLVALTKILTCFYDVSGLRINLSKCNLFGIGVSDPVVKDMADKIRCQVSSLPFTYLGLPVGGNMKKKALWSVVVEKINKKLSAWKSKCISIGGRLTLIQSVLSAIPLFFFSLFKAPKAILKLLESIRRRFFWGFKDDEKKLVWIAWKKVLKSKSNGGLGVTSFKIKNDALLSKWIWRFLSSKDAIWKDVIAEFYGPDGGLFSSSPLSGKSTWAAIVNGCRDLQVAGQTLIASFSKTIAKDSQSLFWEDLAIGQGSKLKDIYPRLYALEKNKNACFKERWILVNGSWCGAWDWKSIIRGRSLDDLQSLENQLSSMSFNMSGQDFWTWDLGKNGVFSVKQMTKFLQNSSDSEEDDSVCCVWNPLIPNKINIFIWRFLKEAIPVRFNLSKKGISVQSMDCILCGKDVETMDHCFFSCPISNALWRKIWAWWDLKSPRLSTVSEFKKLIRRRVFSENMGRFLFRFARWRYGRFGGGETAFSLPRKACYLQRKGKIHFQLSRTFQSCGWVIEVENST
ncbi:hypothetical protein OSB04_un001812 [Centaurea solstitialis]|uniref:Reverse transcriptase domain-containing protein n=1 Tax=Centaurea solstitialis TaxID=347529 RepID=A0AA38S3F6_9ASTR|nr:hypothetical protein OSB04_un001812 [Centaurea solstitialis]